jgi:nicotinamidase-related amidase
VTIRKPWLLEFSVGEGFIPSRKTYGFRKVAGGHEARPYDIRPQTVASGRTLAMNAYQELLQRDDCLLMLVDIQKVMLDLCVEPEVLRKNVSALLEVAQVLGIPSLFTVHNTQKLGGALPELLKKAVAAPAINKIEFSCFENPAIADAVRQTGRRTLVLAGIETHVCVFHTGAHALRLGYRVHVVADAVTSRSAFNRLIGLGRLEKAGAVLSSTEMLTFELLQRAGTQEFRTLLPLLKTFK